MTSVPKDGGPAFPSSEAHPNYDFPMHFHGMSLRDWFAGQALTGLLASGQWHNSTVQPGFAEHMADHAHELADAMLAARQKGEGQPVERHGGLIEALSTTPSDQRSEA